MPDVKEMGRIRVSVDDAKAHHDESCASFLDVIDTVSYDQVDDQVEGAVRIAPEKLEEEFEKLPEERAVFAYCT